MENNKPHISYSQIRLFDNCKFAYNKSYNENVPTIPSSPLKKGKTIHRFIELYQECCIKKNKKSDMSHANILKRGFRRSQLFFMQNEDHHELNEEEIQDVFQMFDNFVDNFSIDYDFMKYPEIEKKVAVNKDMEIVDFDSPDVLFKGIIDFVYVQGNHTVIITDYKSDRFIESETVLKDNMQLKIYAYLMSLIYPKIKEFKVRYYYVRYNKYHEHKLTWADLERVGFYLKSNHKRIKEAVNFEPTLKNNLFF